MQTMLMPGLSLVALAAGATTAAMVRPSGRLAYSIDGFVSVMMVGLVLLHILPGAWAALGPWAVGIGLVGLATPLGLHRVAGRLGEGAAVHPLVAALALGGLALHAMMDGAALVGVGSGGFGEAERALALAVLLHRFPLALALWWLVRPMLGVRAAVALLGVVAGGTVLGFVAAQGALAELNSPAVAGFQALLAGMLLHVVLGGGAAHHHPAQDEPCPFERPPVPRGTRLGLWGVGAAGAAVLLSLI